jgi:hypothetical protein
MAAWSINLFYLDYPVSSEMTLIFYSGSKSGGPHHMEANKPIFKNHFEKFHIYKFSINKVAAAWSIHLF